jgi:hypothetical protein
MRTGQFVDPDIELVHSTAAPQLGRNSTCNIFDWTFLSAEGLLVHQSINLSKKVLTGQLVVAQVHVRQLHEVPHLGRDCTCQRFFSHKATNGRLTTDDEVKVQLPKCPWNSSITYARSPTAPTQAK